MVLSEKNSIFVASNLTESQSFGGSRERQYILEGVWCALVLTIQESSSSSTSQELSNGTPYEVFYI